jgi:CysZ protein
VLKEIVLAISSFGSAHAFISKHRLWKWVFISGILYALFLVGCFYFFGRAASYLLDEQLLEQSGLRLWISRINSGLLSFMFSFTLLVIWLIFALCYLSLAKYLWLFLASPLLRYLNGVIAFHLGETNATKSNTLSPSMGRALGMPLRNLLWQSVYLLALFLLALVPIAGWVIPFFALLIECYFWGFSMLDYAFSVRNLDYKNTISFSGGHKGYALGNGIIFYLLHLIPIAGWVAAPFYTQVAAALLCDQVLISPENS